MINKKIVIIGAGNMGKALANSLLTKKILNPINLIISTPHIEQLTDFSKQGVEITTDNILAITQADVIIFCIKPQIAPQIFAEIKQYVHHQLIISVMAGVKISTIESALKKKLPIIRSMPNLCANIGESMTGWIKNSMVNSEQTDLVKNIFRAFGKEIELENESDINSITAISGSGPAYFFYLAELLIKSAEELGISNTIAQKLVKQTFTGAALTLQKSEISPSELRKKVTSKGGTTEAAFKVLYNENVARIIIDAVKAAQFRAEELNT